MVSDERARRIGNNEALFREANERLESLNEAFATLTDTFEVTCECGDVKCLERFTVPIGEYERVRRDASLFLIVAGHDAPDVEDVVERHEEYMVVRKRPGVAQDVAERMDPRS
jgi:hypothetical protein